MLMKRGFNWVQGLWDENLRVSGIIVEFWIPDIVGLFSWVLSGFGPRERSDDLLKFIFY